MTPLTTERLFWHCGAQTAEPKVGDVFPPIPPIPDYQNLLFSVARGGSHDFLSRLSPTCWDPKKLCLPVLVVPWLLRCHLSG